MEGHRPDPPRGAGCSAGGVCSGTPSSWETSPSQLSGWPQLMIPKAEVQGLHRRPMLCSLASWPLLLRLPPVLLPNTLVSLVSVSAPINQPAPWSGVGVSPCLSSPPFVTFCVSPASSLANTPMSSYTELVLLKQLTCLQTCTDALLPPWPSGPPRLSGSALRPPQNSADDSWCPGYISH